VILWLRHEISAALLHVQSQLASLQLNQDSAAAVKVGLLDVRWVSTAARVTGGGDDVGGHAMLEVGTKSPH